MRVSSKGLPLAMGMCWQAHVDLWQASCFSISGTELQPYIKPSGFLNSNPKQFAHIWYVLRVSYDLAELRHLKRDSAKRILVPMKQGVKCTYLVWQSIHVVIVLNPEHNGNEVIRSILHDLNKPLGIGKEFNKPRAACVLPFCFYKIG